LKAAAVTVVLTTHSMVEAEELCDRLAIVDHGRLVAGGTPAELTQGGPQRELTFSTDAGLAVGELGSVLGLQPNAITEARPGEYRVASQATPALVAELAIWLRDHDICLGELRAGRHSLEEVFLRLTGPALQESADCSERDQDAELL
jgi:ABC-2 type transport system ATP-binding protein